jgi:hypothetical protein
MTDDPAALGGQIDGRRIASHSGSDASLALIRKWVVDCSKEHIECLHSSSLGRDADCAFKKPNHPPLPTRVIDVGPTDGSHNPFIWVTEGSYGEYLSLSHCWGKTKPFTTTLATLEERKTGFTMEMLPKTFQDAIFITRSVGFRYLWIDSLCIIQDSPADWSHESSRMANIYADAFFTIAATASPNSQTGFLSPRKSGATVELSYKDPQSEKIGHAYIYPDILSFKDPVRRSPLNVRGWTLQERILSRRILHFASAQLFWDCQHSFLSENGVYASKQADAANNPLRQSLRQLDFHGPDLPYNHRAFSWPASILGRWMELVNEFTRRELTYDSDALPALAGIVSRVAGRTGDQFLAGIWRSTLHIELLWLAFDAPHSSPAAYRAPSWSWAALVGESQYYNYTGYWKNLVPDFEVKEAEVTWAAKPFISALLSARLVVTGLLEPAHYVKDHILDRLPEVDSWELIPASNKNSEKRGYAYNWAVFDQVPPPEDQVLWCLCVCRSNTDEHWVLILEAVSDEDATYKRIGTGRIDVDTTSFGGGQRLTINMI